MVDVHKPATLRGFHVSVADVGDQMHLCHPLLSFQGDSALYLAHRLDWRNAHEVLEVVDPNEAAALGTLLPPRCRPPIASGEGLVAVGAELAQAAAAAELELLGSEIPFMRVDDPECWIGVATPALYTALRTRLVENARTAFDDELAYAACRGSRLSERGSAALLFMRKCGPRRRDDLVIRQLAGARQDEEYDLYRRLLIRFALELDTQEGVLDERVKRHVAVLADRKATVLAQRRESETPSSADASSARQSGSGMTANASTASPMLRADYQPYPFAVTETALAFDIQDGETTVHCDMAIERRGERGCALVLNGAELQLDSIAVDGRSLGGNEYAVDGETLTIFDVPNTCRVHVVTRIAPEKNSTLEGLYKSGAMYCTQCEPEGFRKITYYPDRPDVLSRFTTTITADAKRFPVLLSNGNPIADATHDRRRTVTWQDPFPKPSYLFALVAGDLAVLADEFVTCSGRTVALRIYSEPHNIGQCGYAMEALKRAMRWDEERFGREYDLDIFMIVAVESFNMGAMENKGLNIFNTSCVLATPDTATDAAHQRVEGVVAHEYFHNWSGNRVTCRDWFQLSLKEGFTVYRDAEFSSDMNSRTAKRVEDVDFLRSVQFVEDGGPLAHPVRPESYLEINNFYTATVYEKGAEVVRMMATILGRDRFRAGADAYFDRHDGCAVTIEDFIAEMERVAEAPLPQFRRWYEQAGTPLLTVAEERRGDSLALTIDQSCPATPGQPQKQPFHIPLAFGLVDASGGDLLGAAGAGSGVRLSTAAKVENPDGDGTLVAHLTEPRTTLAFSAVQADANVSFLRGFSAPVQVRYRRDASVLRRLATTDSDGFARWDAGQTLLADSLLASARGLAEDKTDEVLELFRALGASAPQLPDDGEAKALLASMLTLPLESWLLEMAPGTDILAICRAWDALADRIADSFDWLAVAAANEVRGGYRPNAADSARRQLKHRALSYALRRLDREDPKGAADLLSRNLREADNLTDRLAALQCLLGLRSLGEDAKERQLEAFYQCWSAEALVVDAWFGVQAGNPLPGTLARVQALQEHAAFDIENPNKARALLLRFTANMRNFHAADGAAYRWAGDIVVAIDGFNPQVASRFAKTLTAWPRFDTERGLRMRTALAAVGEHELSKDVREVVDKGLSADAAQ